MSYTADCATWTEVLRQPAIWRDWSAPLQGRAAAIRDWIADKGIRELWFCGAGTSAYLGDILAAEPHPDLRLRAVPTTDIVACPQDYLPVPEDVLIVQFGRSGSSSETIGLLDLLDRAAPQAHRLHITCNPEGALATRPGTGTGETRVLLLPEATHDAGFAMTSSFTTMLLSALAVLEDPTRVPARMAHLATEAEALLTRLSAHPVPRPERAIFLGSGALKGVAREAALKVLELTAGQSLTQWDSTLGYRHGPKAAAAPGARFAVMIHPHPHTARYDMDVATEIARQYPDATVLTLGPKGCDIGFEGTGHAGWDGVLYVLAGQVWSVMWSDALGLNIDNPFADQGNLSRVVAGVTLYPWEVETA
ncbi:phosphosugar isomerase [Pseudooceanicola sp. CBS1P-1]|uniref:Phosphosugar isomerase n=1 Tax=Pseudooceanicola albus TaxID=2692189 RepID=A0A6L7G517_9RHOB|nr:MULTISPECIES: SIS domain-containing protein [Pseudooceanicola]MBT9385202.1 phosphosugar isomerase [Pseudooceanicola endophyticus]MXN18506.1 phosphosugar isomerase [Pseudooceanicola albus]